MTKISILKDVYEEFKYFKGIYTKINLANSIQLIGSKEENRVNIIFVRDSSFSHLFGQLKGETQFLNWIKDGNKTVHLLMSDIISLGKILKKNVVEISFDDKIFIFNYIDSENNSKSLVIEKDSEEESKIIKKAFFDLEYKFNKKEEIPEDFLKSDIIEIFKDGENISKVRNKDKIIEIPKARLNSLIKDEKVFIEYSGKDDIGSRLVSLSSSSEKLGLELHETFRTI